MGAASAETSGQLRPRLPGKSSRTGHYTAQFGDHNYLPAYARTLLFCGGFWPPPAGQP